MGAEVFEIRRVFSALSKAGVRVKEDPDIPTAAAVFNEAGEYEIRISPKLLKADKEVVMFTLRHEMAHIVMGDLIRMKQKENPKAWNLAADARIHEDKELIKAKDKVEKIIQGEIITYTKIREKIAPKLPKRFPTTEKVYKEILKEAGASGGGGASFDEHRNEFKGTDKEAARKHASAVTKIRDAISKDKALKEIMEEMGEMIGSLHSKRSSSKKYEPVQHPSLDGLIKAIQGTEGRREFKRTWRRPGLARGVKGAAYLPRAKVVVLVDVSGSTSLCQELFQQLMEWLRVDHEAVAYAHDCLAWKLEGDEFAESGGGTAFRDAYKKAANEEPDIVVHFTDLEVNDVNEMGKVRCPVIVGHKGSFIPAGLPDNVEVVKL